MIRTGLKSTSALLKFRLFDSSLSSVRPFTNVYQNPLQRTYTSSRNFDSKNFPDEEANRIEMITATLKQNTEVRTLLEEFQSLLQNKGFRTDKAPSMMEMLKLMTEKDVKEHVAKLKVALEKANVTFSAEDIKAFMNFMTLQK